VPPKSSEIIIKQQEITAIYVKGDKSWLIKHMLQ